MTVRQWLASWCQRPPRPNGEAHYAQDLTPQVEKDKLLARYDLIDQEFEKAFGKPRAAEARK